MHTPSFFLSSRSQAILTTRQDSRGALSLCGECQPNNVENVDRMHIAWLARLAVNWTTEILVTTLSALKPLHPHQLFPARVVVLANVAWNSNACNMFFQILSCPHLISCFAARVRLRLLPLVLLQRQPLHLSFDNFVAILGSEPETDDKSKGLSTLELKDKTGSWVHHLHIASACLLCIALHHPACHNYVGSRPKSQT